MKKAVLAFVMALLFLSPLLYEQPASANPKPMDCSGWQITTNGYGVDQTSAEEDGCNNCVNACVTLNGWPEQCSTVACSIKGGIWRCTVTMCCHF